MRVFVGLSGGVDSSVSAALLVQAGYDVTGVYMKNWSRDLPGMTCPWAEDLADAKRVAVRLGIDFKVFDFEQQYKHKVVDYMIREYELGRTPNPDVMCNQEVKFKLFLDTALEDGADAIATGHYAQVGQCCQNVVFPALTGSDHQLAQPLRHFSRPSLRGSALTCSPSFTSRAEAGRLVTEPRLLMKAKDANKDQTYFLYRITEQALEKTIFPVGHLAKPQVRKLAAQFDLPTATKKDSQGICFVGSVGIRDFLGEFVQTTPGNIIERKTGKVLGTHDGAIFYTFGQRHGLDVGGGLPYYVVGKD
ncbi:tRNA 2-thiouridine(34) synthase MnmA, partial [Candidatus Saccharibacteria bacterium]|nr:tRNA 2-thiouridine(34) synthase MnmA [Candidatus Saccharibacteria bacterium]